MKGNVIVGQSGGPTAAINSSLAGVYRTAKDRGPSNSSIVFERELLIAFFPLPPFFLPSDLYQSSRPSGRPIRNGNFSVLERIGKEHSLSPHCSFEFFLLFSRSARFSRMVSLTFPHVAF